MKLAAVSCPSHPRDVKKNLEKITEWVDRAASQGVDMVLFPEYALPGMGCGSLTTFSAEDKLYWQNVSEPVPDGPSVQALIGKAKENGIYICWGMCERDEENPYMTYNTSVLVGPEGYVGKYRKVHFPVCERLYHSPGVEFPVFDTKFGKVGLITCFDKMFPEAARSMAVKGAEIILCGTGWPNLTQSEEDPDHKAYLTISPARALENMVIWAEATTCNGAGSPPVFEGHSMILGPSPQQFYDMIGFEEGMAVADIDVQDEIRQARIVSMQGSDILRDRVPSAYSELVKFNKYAPYSIGLRALEG